MIDVGNCFERGCKHFLGVKRDLNDSPEVNERVYCLAYPDRIPDDIAYGDNKHLKVRSDQENDIVYEKEIAKIR